MTTRLVTGFRVSGCRPPEPLETYAGDEYDLARSRVLLTADVSRRLRPVCSGVGMSEQEFCAVVQAIVEIKLGWVRRRLLS